MFSIFRAALALASLRVLNAIRVIKKRSGEEEDYPDMEKVLIPAEDGYEGGKCMDGSQAGYYYRAGGTNTWVIHLAGGGGCSDYVGCDDWLHKNCNTSSMGCKGSSDGWAQTKAGTGSQDTDPEKNPVFHDAHHVFVPYCTADSHAGRVGTLAGPVGTLDPANAPMGNYYFDGHLNVKAILEHLSHERPAFANMEHMLFQGKSAGGIGVFRNCDVVGDIVRRKVGRDVVKCNPVVGWYVPAFTEDHDDDRLAPPTPFYLWKIEQLASVSEVDANAAQDPYYPKSCLAKLRDSDKPWSCGSASFIYPTMRQPVFVTQDIFDPSQIQFICGMHQTNVGTCTGNAFISYFGKSMVNTTTKMISSKPGNGLFLTSCYDHGSSTATIQGKNKYQALNAWWTGDGSAPSVLVDDCHASSWLPCGQGCTHVPPC